MEMKQKIHGAKTSSLAAFKEYDYLRRQALLTMNEKHIRSFYESYDIVFPPKNESFWEAVAKNVLNLKDVPMNIRMEAIQILDELNIDYGAWNDEIQKKVEEVYGMAVKADV